MPLNLAPVGLDIDEPNPVYPAEIARRLGVRTEWVYRNYQTLIDRDGFPRPLLSFGRRKWSRAAVEGWFAGRDRRVPAAIAFAHDEPPEEIDLGAERENLAAAYRGSR